jgi:hypothetical protein
MKKTSHGDYVIRVKPKAFEIGVSAAEYRAAVGHPPYGLNELLGIEILNSEFFPEDFDYELIRSETGEGVVAGQKSDLYDRRAPRHLIDPLKTED